ncbi:magnesium-translocating P-type ATPase [Sulfurihydrogenibium azorense]|uniref:Magnesium-transporting ATPase, P-type 1 n=1 Tax=Sulfurihydrogenibium azorense (strain DSM 15241 / OCM 825 / Az-Fu1) TaxID=204536 RepID=C1DVV0_SULAA|nr:magnesium-translocating P-type ATPase [Sulfurihydrogenibium azorense]ACN99563.1 magnesium-translocating P-type ATPase [Sulfurihydrogenibium azorense Az-Fu1]MDM7273584.1 magnesium-translocating P-type ATPase [Sulfurihydrogenibium azorense]
MNIAELVKKLNTDIEKGLTEEEAKRRLKIYGYNTIKEEDRFSDLKLFINQFKNPFILLLLFASFLSYLLGDKFESLIIILIVFLGGVVDFFQERSAHKTIESLRSLVKVKATVIRSGQKKEIHLEDIVVGDIVILTAGDVVPADCIVIESKDLFVNESILTGESYPVEKMETEKVFKGSYVVSGFAKALCIAIGKDTEFGKIASKYSEIKYETDFERNLRRFGYLLTEVAFVLILIVFFVNVYFHRPVVESFLFALSLSIGITPTLLPAIVTVALSVGAKKMADKKVVVKRLISIENFGSMNVLCCDKTGTITQGIMKLVSYKDLNNKENEKVFLLAYLNAYFQTGFKNPIDEALISYKSLDIDAYKKIDEIPYDFNRKRLSIFVKTPDSKNLLITKGAVKNILQVCEFVEINNKVNPLTDEYKEKILNNLEDFSKKGYRVLAVAYKFNDKDIIGFSDESKMIFLGFLIFEDPLKEDVLDAINILKEKGIKLKILTGDNRFVAKHIGEKLNLNNVLTSEDLHNIHPDALVKVVEKYDIFAELTPSQKEDIIQALRKGGNVVGYIGDGVNDVPPMKSADVSISVDNAVDIAKESADIVLLEKSLKVLLDGVLEGRKAFVNTLKYIFMQTSSNFGNIFSMAGASFIIPFLPLLPKQVLASNFLTDFAVITIPNDNVDEDWINTPKKWDFNFIKSFMVVFGLISSFFDYVTFGVLLFIFHLSPEYFRSGWFIEAMLTQLLVILVLRTKNSFYRSKPSNYLAFSILTIVSLTFIIPYTPIGEILEIKPLPLNLLIIILSIVFLYIAVVEFVKLKFYKVYS